MAYKIYNKQGNVFYIKGFIFHIPERSDPLTNNTTMKQLATTLARSLNIQPHTQELVFILGYADCQNNLEAIMVWLSKQGILNSQAKIDFQELYNSLSSYLENLVTGHTLI